MDYRYVIEEGVGMVAGAPDNAVCWRVWDTVAEIAMMDWTTNRRIVKDYLAEVRADLEPRPPFDPEAFAAFRADPKRQALVRRILED